MKHLQQWFDDKGYFPDTLYLQIDGGSENANKYLLSMCEILIGLRIVNKIVATRLPVGHTHEDIDAQFAKLWVAFRSFPVWTPQTYEEKIRETFQDSKIPAEVIDIFAVPDYCGWMEKQIDGEFVRYEFVD